MWLDLPLFVKGIYRFHDHKSYELCSYNPVRSMSGISGLKMAIFGSVRVGENFVKIFCNRDEKIKNMVGRSGIGVLVTGLSRVGALKKHAPLVFSPANLFLLSRIFRLI